MTVKTETPVVYAITEEELNNILNILGEVPAKLSFNGLDILRNVKTRQIPEDVVKSMTQPAPEPEDAPTADSGKKSNKKSAK